MKDYNGIEIPTKVKASKIEIRVIQRYVGKYGTEEDHVLESCNLEEFCGLDDVLRNLEVEYEEI
jgi:hypothetical protein